MTFALTSTTLTDTARATVFKSDAGGILSIKGDRGAEISAHVPAHVATATAAAFNRAMEVTEADCGLWYDTPAGQWLIKEDYTEAALEWSAGQPPTVITLAPINGRPVTLEQLQIAVDDMVPFISEAQRESMA